MASHASYFAWPRQAWSDLSLRAAVKGSEMALRYQIWPEFLIDKLTERVGEALSDTEGDPETIRHLRWFGSHLKPFLYRLVRERPAAAAAIARFLGTYTKDVYRRNEGQMAGRVSPSTVVIEPTDRCNLHCPGCYAKSSCDGSDLPYERLVEIVEQVIDMGVSLITISGGEPFLRELADHAISRLAEHFPDRGFLVYTNGTIMTEEIATRLGKHGNVFPAISVEGFESQTDSRRGRGVYSTDRRTRQMLARHGVMTGFSATITRLNAEILASDAFIDERIREGDLFGWFFLLQPIGRGPRPDLMSTGPQRALIREAVIRWRESDRPIFLGDFWNDGALVEGCIAAGKYYFHIYANGDISPCVFSPIACGNIFDIIAGKSEYSSLRDFVQRHPVFVAYREEQKRITDRASPCLLIDHPEAFRRIYKIGACRPAKNMPPGYLDGEISRIIDERAAEWNKTTPNLPPMIREGSSHDGGPYPTDISKFSKGVPVAVAAPGANTFHQQIQ